MPVFSATKNDIQEFDPAHPNVAFDEQSYMPMGRGKGPDSDLIRQAWASLCNDDFERTKFTIFAVYHPESDFLLPVFYNVRNDTYNYSSVAELEELPGQFGLRMNQLQRASCRYPPQSVERSYWTNADGKCDDVQRRITMLLSSPLEGMLQQEVSTEVEGRKHTNSPSLEVDNSMSDSNSIPAYTDSAGIMGGRNTTGESPEVIWKHGLDSEVLEEAWQEYVKPATLSPELEDYSVLSPLTCSDDLEYVEDVSDYHPTGASDYYSKALLEHHEALLIEALKRRRIKHGISLHPDSSHSNSVSPSIFTSVNSSQLLSILQGETISRSGGCKKDPSHDYFRKSHYTEHSGYC